MSFRGYQVRSDQYGFSWGPARVVRIADDLKWGVLLEIRGNAHTVEIRVTPKGYIRLGPLVKTPVYTDAPDER